MGADQHKKLFDVARTLRERKPSDVDNYLARTPSRQQLALALEQQKLLRACADLDHVGDAISVEVNFPSLAAVPRCLVPVRVGIATKRTVAVRQAHVVCVRSARPCPQRLSHANTERELRRVRMEVLTLKVPRRARFAASLDCSILPL